MVAFSAPEYQRDATIRITPYRFDGSTDSGWRITRDGIEHLQLGPGYEALQVSHCGVCSTDLVRQHLPFALPQITGHEVVAIGERGRPVAVEINATCRGRRRPHGEWCSLCAADLETHCRRRLVLGIHDLPGGFSPWILAPVGNVLVVPAEISPATATLIEPFAAALQAVDALDLTHSARVAVLGSGRLGLLLVAALAAERVRCARSYEIVAIARYPHQRELAAALGADDTVEAEHAAAGHDMADIVIDATGSPSGLEAAVRLATREVHVKSTTGEPALGLGHMTALVVDEMTLLPLDVARLATAAPRLPSPPTSVALLLGEAIPDGLGRQLASHGLRVMESTDPVESARAIEADPGMVFGATDMAVVTSPPAIDAAIRPRPGTETGLVRPRGVIHVADVGQARDGLLGALLDKRLRISTSRCGSLRRAVATLADPALDLGTTLGARLVRHKVPAARLSEAFALATRPEVIKVAATHGGTLLR